MQSDPDLEETSMKRILSLTALAVALALATGTTALATRHATKSGAAPTAAARCTDPAHCPFGSCPLGAKTASAASTPTAGKSATCSDPAKCTSACRPGNSGTTAAVVNR